MWFSSRGEQATSQPGKQGRVKYEIRYLISCQIKQKQTLRRGMKLKYHERSPCRGGEGVSRNNSNINRNVRPLLVFASHENQAFNCTTHSGALSLSLADPHSLNTEPMAFGGGLTFSAACLDKFLFCFQRFLRAFTPLLCGALARASVYTKRGKKNNIKVTTHNINQSLFAAATSPEP
jgi:hypothetical protein